MSHGKQFTLYTHKTAPNGWKVALVLEELGLSYEPVYLNFNKNEQKEAPHVTYNPNGRIPTLVDHHNGDYALSESCAILLYLVDKYDVEKRLTVTDDNEKHKLIQWLFFQASGQGPYVGQVFWFGVYHHEKLPSAIERYQAETRRVISVLNGVLAASPSGYLVGGKPTIADLAYVQWNRVSMGLPTEGVDVAKEFPAFFAWQERLTARDSFKKTLEMQAGLKNDGPVKFVQ